MMNKSYKDILTQIRNFFSHSKSLHYLHFDDNISYELSGYKAKIKNFVEIIYKLIKLKSNTFYITSRIVEIPFLYKNLNFDNIHKILDLGCVGSKISLQLASLGYEVVGVDIRPNPLKHQNIKFIQGNFINVNLQPESFDCVICISTIEHIGLPAYNVKPFENGDKKAIKKIFYLLKKSGQLILTVPYGRNVIDKFERNYNFQTLNKLIKDFKINDFKIYEKVKNDWILSKDPSNELEKVACVACTKE